MIRERVFIALVSAAAGVAGVWLGYELKGGADTAIAFVFTPLAGALCGVLGWWATASESGADTDEHRDAALEHEHKRPPANGGRYGA